MLIIVLQEFSVRYELIKMHLYQLDDHHHKQIYFYELNAHVSLKEIKFISIFTFEYFLLIFVQLQFMENIRDLNL